MSSQFNPPPFGNDGAGVTELAGPLADAKGWMKFVGIMFIVQGAFIALSIIGILIAWLPIWTGVLLLQSSSAIERAQLRGDAAAFKESLARLKTYFVIQGVLYIVGIALMVVYFLIFGAVFMAMLKNGIPH